jgi:hypothetical protein
MLSLLNMELLTQGETMKDFLLGMVAGVLAFGIPAIVYVWKTGGIS